jgi:hypothetical protein
MTKQLGNQERRSNTWGVLHCARLAMGRLALCKGEGEGEGLFLTTFYGDSKPLTFVLSPSQRGEAAEAAMDRV